MINRIKSSKGFIKWTNWEFWPMWLAYMPVIPVILFYALRARRFFFFSNVNPKFKTGALMGASKYQILEHIPEAYKPTTLFISKHNRDINQVKLLIAYKEITYPLIAKPDIGERGLLVTLINDESELQNYLEANEIDILIQEYIDLPEECGIFYIRKPGEDKGNVVSIGLKKFLIIYGDGTSSIRTLMQLNPRAKLQIERLEQADKTFLSYIPKMNEAIKIEPIGNHNRGTTFIDGNHLISNELNALFDRINADMPDVHYGRFDVKYKSWEQLLEGQDIKILEMNGVASEPIHIYDSNVRIRDKYKSFYKLWKQIYEISNIQKTRGVEPITLSDAWKAFQEYKKYLKSINLNWKV